MRRSTLRVIVLMFEGRQRAAYDLVISQTQFILEGIGGEKGFDPIKANPYRRDADVSIADMKPPEVKAMEARATLAAMGRILGNMFPRRKPKPGAPPADDPKKRYKPDR